MPQITDIIARVVTVNITVVGKGIEAFDDTLAKALDEAFLGATGYKAAYYGVDTRKRVTARTPDGSRGVANIEIMVNTRASQALVATLCRDVSPYLGPADEKEHDAPLASVNPPA